MNGDGGFLRHSRGTNVLTNALWDHKLVENTL